ncbi:MAG: hypothetical protein ACRCT8_15805 [Lacipirellulaceae bacterium]
MSILLAIGCVGGAHWPPSAASSKDIRSLPASQRDVRAIGLSSDEIVTLVQRLSALEYLFVNSTSEVTDESIKQISHLTELRQLVVDDASRVTDDAIRDIAAMPKLRELILDKAMLLTDRSLDTLSGNNRLEILYIFGARGLSAEAKAAVIRRLPHCEVRFE